MADPNEFKDFQDLYEELQQQKQNTPEYEEFLTAIKALDGKMSALYRKDNYGRIPLVRQEDKDELLAMHRTLGEKAEAFLKAPAVMSKQLEKTYGTVKKLAGLNSAFYTATNHYDPTKGKALHTIHEEARTPVIDTRNHQLKAQVGGVLSKRQPLTFLDPSGKEVTGVFIPEKYENGAKNIVEAFTKGDAFIKAKTINGKRTLQRVLSNLQDLNEEDQEDPYHTAKYAVRLAEIGSDPPKFTAQSICDYINTTDLLVGSSVQKEIGAASLNALADTLNANYQNMIMNTSAQIPAGSRIDTRNAAMSSVAELLDVPHIIARARPMQIIDQNGKTVNGTFMTAAEGVDPANVPKEASKIGLSAGNGTNGNAFKQIADLQVLDYICGNIDRHGNNFFMQFDKKGKLIGVQGIDNDCSGGLIVPKYNDSYNRMTGPKDMQVISESMYRKLKSLSPEQLKFALRGYGVSEAEMDAHVERVNKVLAAADKNIEFYKKNPTTKPFPGRLMIVPDDQFKKLKLADLATYKKTVYHGMEGQDPTNLFAQVQENLRDMKMLYEEQEARRKKENKEFETLKSEVAIGEDNRANPGAIRRQQQKADKLYNEMDKRTNFWKFFWKSSKKYEDMETAMKNYKNYQKELLTRLELAQDPNYTGKKKNASRNFDREAVVSKEDLEKLQELGQKVYDTAKIYTDGKAGKSYNDMGTYEKRRYDIGQMSKSFGEQAKKPLTVEELKTLAANEKLAKENEERTAGNKKEAEDRKKGPAPQA